MINRFALSFLCIELDRDILFGVMLVYILLMLMSSPAQSQPSTSNDVHRPPFEDIIFRDNKHII